MKYRFVKAIAIAAGLAITFQSVAYSAHATEGTEIVSEVVNVVEPEATVETDTAVQTEDNQNPISSETMVPENPEEENPSESSESGESVEKERTESITENTDTEIITIEETEVTEEAETVESYSTDYPNTWTNTGNGAADIVGVALTQVGYQETSENHTKYAAWFYGYDNPVAWCAIFISWCADQAGISQSVLYKNASASGSVSYNPYGTPGYAFGTITPRAGDIIFVENNGGGTTDHVGLVVGVDSSYIYTVEGNYSDMVSNVMYSRSNGYRVFANGVQSTKAYISFFARPNYAGSPGTEVTPVASNYETGVYTVRAGSLNVREGPGTGYSAYAEQLNDGDEINVTEVSGDWGKFTKDGVTGWVNLQYCEYGDAEGDAQDDDPAGEGTEYLISASSLNVRSGPGSAYDVIGQVYNGDTVTITEESNGWGKLNVLVNGQEGWVSMSYCSKVTGEPDPGTMTEATTVTTTESSVTTTTKAEEKQTETTTAADASNLGTYVVTASSLTVRKGPGSSYASLGALAKGEEVTVLKEVSGWGLINYNNQTGYVYMYYLNKKDTSNTTTTTTEKPTTTTEKPTTTTTEATTTTTTEQTTTTTAAASANTLGLYQVTASSLTVRKGPSSNYASLGTLSKGTKVTILSQNNSWGVINYNGQTGYIYMKYVVKVEETTTTTEATTTTTTEKPTTTTEATTTTTTEKPTTTTEATTTTTTEKPTTTTEATTTTTTEKATTTTTAAGSSSAGSIYKATTGLNVRQGPGTGYSIVGTLAQNQEVTVYAISGGWAQIIYEQKTAYVSAKYLTYVGEAEKFEAVQIVTQPQSVTVNDYGDVATVSVEATGTGLSYKWYYKDPLKTSFSATSCTSSSCSYEVTSARNARQLYCIITDAQGNRVTSNAVYMRVIGTLVLTTAPKSVVVAQEGYYASIVVDAIGEGVTYTWYYRNAGDTTFKLASCTSNTYRYAVTAARDGREVYCVVSDRYGNKITTDTVTMSYAK